MPIFDTDLPRNEANFAPLTPLAFIQRTAELYPRAAGDRARRAAPELGPDPMRAAASWPAACAKAASARTTPWP